MNTESDKASAGRPGWIAAGFIGAFAASVLTVIYTGLMVEGSPSEFDAGFRSVTLRPGETREIGLYFDVPAPFAAVRLDITLPSVLEPADSEQLNRTVTLVSGSNAFGVAVRAVSAGSGYLEARLIGEMPVALERVFVTIAEE